MFRVLTFFRFRSQHFHHSFYPTIFFPPQFSLRVNHHNIIEFFFTLHFYNSEYFFNKSRRWKIAKKEEKHFLAVSGQHAFYKQVPNRKCGPFNSLMCLLWFPVIKLSTTSWMPPTLLYCKGNRGLNGYYATGFTPGSQK